MSALWCLTIIGFYFTFKNNNNKKAHASPVSLVTPGCFLLLWQNKRVVHSDRAPSSQSILMSLIPVLGLLSVRYYMLFVKINSAINTEHNHFACAVVLFNLWSHLHQKNCFLFFTGIIELHMSEFPHLPHSCVITEEAFDISIMNKYSKS